jgi:hypothetical protein
MDEAYLPIQWRVGHHRDLVHERMQSEPLYPSTDVMLLDVWTEDGWQQFLVNLAANNLLLVQQVPRFHLYRWHSQEGLPGVGVALLHHHLFPRVKVGCKGTFAIDSLARERHDNRQQVVVRCQALSML